MAVGSLSSSGQYINIDALVQNAVRVQQQRLTDLQTQKSATDTKVSNLGKAKSTLSSLEDKFKAIGTAFKNVVVSGAPDSAKVTATDKGLYSVSVDSLATTQMISSKSSFSKNALGYEGSLKINAGAYDANNNFTSSDTSVDVAISATDTLQDIVKKVNDSQSGVSASIINGDDGQHISFSSTTSGAANGFQIAATDANATGLSSLSYTQGVNSSFNNVSAAADGKATANGVTISSSDNNFKVSDSFSLSANSTFTTKQINVNRDDAAVTKAMTDFATAYNSAATSIKGMDVDNQLKGFTNQIRNTIGKEDFSNSISALGFSFDKTGVMSFDSAKYNKLAASNGANLSSIVKSQFGATSPVVNLFESEVRSSGVIDSQVSTLNAKSKKLSDNISTNTDLLTAQTTAYQLQFSKLDQYLAQLNDNSGKVGQLLTTFTKQT